MPPGRAGFRLQGKVHRAKDRGLTCQTRALRGHVGMKVRPLRLAVRVLAWLLGACACACAAHLRSSVRWPLGRSLARRRLLDQRPAALCIDNSASSADLRQQAQRAPTGGGLGSSASASCALDNRGVRSIADRCTPWERIRRAHRWRNRRARRTYVPTRCGHPPLVSTSGQSSYSGGRQLSANRHAGVSNV